MNFLQQLELRKRFVFLEEFLEVLKDKLDEVFAVFFDDKFLGFGLKFLKHLVLFGFHFVSLFVMLCSIGIFAGLLGWGLGYGVGDDNFVYLVVVLDGEEGFIVIGVGEEIVLVKFALNFLIEDFGLLGVLEVLGDVDQPHLGLAFEHVVIADSCPL